MLKESDRNPASGLFDLHADTYAKRDAMHVAARAAVAAAIRRGDLVIPKRCQRCSKRHTLKRRLQAHHADHARPLDVDFLCITCHAAVEKKKRRRSPPSSTSYQQSVLVSK